MVVSNNGEIRTFTSRGVLDLFTLLNNSPEFLDGAVVADKVIGKGAAVLMIAGHVEEAYAEVISDPALKIFNEYHVKISYGRVVPHIINRTGTDICPVEKMCGDSDSIENCVGLITDFIIR